MCNTFFNKKIQDQGEFMSFYQAAFPDLYQMESTKIEQFLQSFHQTLMQTNKKLSLYHENGAQFWSLSSADEQVVEEYLGAEIKKDQGEAEVFKDHVYFNGKYYSFMNIAHFPDNRPLGILSLYSDMNYFVTFKKINNAKAKSKVDILRRTNFASMHTDIRNIDAEKSYQTTDELLDQLVEGAEALFEFEVYFYIISDDIVSIKEQKLKFIERMSQEGFVISQDTYSASYAFENYIGKNGHFKRSHVAHTSFLTKLLPLTTDFLMSEGYKFKSQNFYDVNFQIFDTNSNNYGMTISGSPGSGKSKLGNKIILEECQRGAKAVLLDRSGSYQKTCHFLDGVELDGKVNPLIYKDPLYLKSFLMSVIPDEFKDLQKEGALYLYLKKLNLDSINNVHELLALLGDKFWNFNCFFAETLDIFDDSLPPETDLLYVDFDKYPKKALGPLLVFIIRHFYSIEGRKILLMDECHHLLKSNIDFVEKVFRELRKKMGAPIALTQDFNDFISTPIGQVIANCSFYKIFFEQSISRSEFITDFDFDAISSVKTKKGQYSEFYLKSENHKKILKYVPTNFEYELFTSDYLDNKDQGRFMNMIEKLGYSFKEQLNMWVRFKYEINRDATDFIYLE